MIKWSTPWSAATRRRFGLRRPDAALSSRKQPSPRQVTAGQSADRSAHSKEFAFSLDQRFIYFSDIEREHKVS